jgi:hypothetical protein
MGNRRTIATLVSSIGLLFGTFALATPAHATFPGHNGRLVFRRYLNNAHSHGAIFTINADGTRERQVTHPRPGVLDAERIGLRTAGGSRSSVSPRTAAGSLPKGIGCSR